MEQWLEGPGEDEAYVMTHDERQQAYQTMKDIYNQQSISQDNLEKISELELEFFGYSPAFRMDIKYITSNDNKSRGWSFLNTQGQDGGITPIYIANLFNPEKNVIISVFYHIPGDSKDIKRFNEKINKINMHRDWDTFVKPEWEQVMNEFKNFVENTPRDQISFGNIMNQVDNTIKTLTFD